MGRRYPAGLMKAFGVSALCVLLVLSVTASVVARPTGAKPPVAKNAAVPKGIQWVIVTKDADTDNPSTKLSLSINGKATLLATLRETFNVLEKADYAGNKIPKSAVTAVKGWWAGQGHTFYVSKVGSAYKVYRRADYEESGPEKFKLFKTLKG